MGNLMPFWLVTILMGIVEGLTEFLPISSTGHLILADHFLGFTGMLGDSTRAQVFEVVIQSGAILAVFLLYRRELGGVILRSWRVPGPERRLLGLLILAFVPAVVAALLLGDVVERHLFNPLSVAGALVVGGVVILLIERLPLVRRTVAVGEMTMGQALWIGLAQVASLFPGVSRSGATIMGGLCVGLDRRTSTEFSFLLSFPVMMAASGYTLVKHWRLLDGEMLTVLAGGFVTAFLSAWVVVKWLIRYVQGHDFTVFALYRIGFGALLFWYFGTR